MATLSDIGEAGPAGDFYAWVLKRYQRVILRLILLLLVMMIGAGVAGFWFATRLSALERQERPIVPTVVQTPSEELMKSVDAQDERIDSIQRQMTRRTDCLNSNLVSLNKAIQELVVGRLRAGDFVSEFKLRACR